MLLVLAITALEGGPEKTGDYDALILGTIESLGFSEIIELAKIHLAETHEDDDEDPVDALFDGEDDE